MDDSHAAGLRIIIHRRATVRDGGRSFQHYFLLLYSLLPPGGQPNHRFEHGMYVCTVYVCMYVGMYGHPFLRLEVGAAAATSRRVCPSLGRLCVAERGRSVLCADAGAFTRLDA